MNKIAADEAEVQRRMDAIVARHRAERSKPAPNPETPDNRITREMIEATRRINEVHRTGRFRIHEAGCLLLVAALAALASPHASAATCMLEESTPAPYYALGTLVQPQADLLAVGECGKSYSELDAAYVAAEKARPSPRADLYAVRCTTRMSSNYRNVTTECGGY